MQQSSSREQSQYIRRVENNQQPPQSEKNCEERKVIPTSNNLNQVIGGLGNQIKPQEEQESPLQAQEKSREEILMFYNRIFSPQEARNSIQQRNQALEISQFDQAQTKASDKNIYERRLRRVDSLNRTQSRQIQQLFEIKGTNCLKFEALKKLFQFICDLKTGLKVDYYSDKTFSALIKSEEQQLFLLYSILTKMYREIINNQNSEGENGRQLEQCIRERVKQFLIIPRFLISKQKILQFVKDENIQENFILLSKNLCLGHYNNEANKRFPERNLIILLIPILEKKNGKEIYKTICSINHGNKYKGKSNSAYQELFSKTLQQLKELDRKLKEVKSRKTALKQKKKTTRSQIHNSSESSDSPEFPPLQYPYKSESQLEKREIDMDAEVYHINISKVEQESSREKVSLNQLIDEREQSVYQNESVYSPQTQLSNLERESFSTRLLQNIVIIPPPSREEEPKMHKSSQDLPSH